MSIASSSRFPRIDPRTVHRNRIRFFAHRSGLVLFFLSIAACGDDRGADVGVSGSSDSAGVVALSISTDPASYFATATVETLGTVVRSGVEMPLVAALVASDYGRSDLVVPLLEAGYRSAPEPFARLYADELAAALLSGLGGSTAENGESLAGTVEPFARELLTRYPDSAAFAIVLLESLFVSEQDEEALELVASLDDRGAGWLTRAEHYRIELIRAVASARNDAPGWELLFTRLYVEQPLSKLHSEAFRFLEETGRSDRFDAGEYRFMRAMSLASVRAFHDAAVELPVESITGERYRTLTVLDSLWTIWYRSGRGNIGFDRFSALARSDAPAPIRAHAWFYAGRSARLVGSRREAIECFTEALRSSASVEFSERARWYLIDTSRLISEAAGIEAISRLGDDIRNRGYYDDTFEELLSALVRSRAWELIARAGSLFESYGSGYIRSLYANIMATIVLERYLLVDGEPESVVAEAHSIVRSTAGRDAAVTYLRLVAGAPLQLPEAASPGDAPIESTQPRSIVLRRFLSLGFADAANRFVARNPGGYEAADLLALALELDGTGAHTDAMRLVDRHLARLVDEGAVAPSRALFELSWPLAYRDPVLGAADLAGVAPALFYGLVREESYFQAEVISSAHAVGLSQLLPATAADMARRMKLDTFDLTRPEDNLAIGAEYLAYLVRLFDSEFLALVAYNAGLGRVREWVRSFGDLPPSLFLEAIPFAETRRYVRKVVSSETMYSRLYPDLAPSGTLPILLPRS